ncbi:MAG: ankyrin repeat domain-containing protein [Parachlamydiaceae bacterium]|nr:ankyrin repeat domain-containing protein [Parachlamydiaceae bacterium]
MHKIIQSFIFLIIFLCGLIQTAFAEDNFQNQYKSENKASLKFKASEMVLMSLEELLSNGKTTGKVQEALIAYHNLQPYHQNLQDFFLNPREYFDNRLIALKTLIQAIPSNSQVLILKKLLNQAKNKQAYIRALPDMLDPRCSYQNEGMLYPPKNLSVRDSYWTEFLDPLHRSGVEKELYKHLWKISSIPNYFIYLDTIEHSPLLEKYAPQNHQVIYLHSQDEREKHKLWFKNGIAYYGKNKFDTVGLDSPFFNNGYATLILGTDGEFYVNNYERYNLQHSSLFASQEVAAAGEVLSNNGKIYRITNKSGHYSPPLENALTTLQAFKDKGVPLNDINVSVILAKGAASYHIRAIYNAADLLANNGKTLCTSALFKWTPLQIAVWKNQFSLAKRAVNTSPINAKNEPGLTALHIATQGGYLKWISFLLSNGADSNICNNHGQTALHIAALQGDHDAIKLLYSHSDNSLRTNSGATALLLSIKSGYLKSFQYFLTKQNIDFSQPFWPLEDRDNDGNGPLYYAVASNNIEMLLLQISKIDPEDILKSNFQGANLLHAAAAYGSPLIFNLLLSYGIDPFLTDNMGQNLFHYAAKNSNRQVCEYLLHRDFTWMLQVKNNVGISPLHYAAEYQSPDFFQNLVHLAEDINIRDNHGNTPLFYAVKSGNVRNLLLLLKHGADIHAYNDDGLSPIHISAASYDKSLNALLTHEDVIDLLDAEGNTPLQTALKHNKTQNALYLIPYNSVKMLFHENRAGISALDQAKKLKDREILEEINKQMTLTKKNPNLKS